MTPTESKDDAPIKCILPEQTLHQTIKNYFSGLEIDFMEGDLERGTLHFVRDRILKLVPDRGVSIKELEHDDRK